MAGWDKGKKKAKNTGKEKKIHPGQPRRPTGIRISEPTPSSVPPRGSSLAPPSFTGASQQSQAVPAYRGPPHGYSDLRAMPTFIPRVGYATPTGYSNRPNTAAIPSASNPRSTTPTGYSNLPNTAAILSSSNPHNISGSVGLSRLRVRDNSSEPPTPTTTQHSDARAPQPGERDTNQRIILVPEGFLFNPNKGVSKVITRIIKQLYRGVCSSWKQVSAKLQKQMFREFKKYFIWLPEHEGKMLFNFKRRAMKRLSNIFADARKTCMS